MKHKVIIDTDPGIDDAMAIFFALKHPDLEVLGLTTVFGNTYVDRCTRNALKILEAANRADIPVIEGSGMPIINPMRPRWGKVHGQDGLGEVGHEFPEPSAVPLNMAAAEFIVDTVMSNPGKITLAPIGPMSNIALALRLEPRIAENVREVAIMGGAVFRGGNASPVAEANIINDPHAAHIMFRAGWKMAVLGLDVTMQIKMTKEHVNQLAAHGSPETDFVAKIVPFYQNAYSQFHGTDGDFYCHDASTLAYLVDPTLFDVERVPVVVETQGKCAGFTIPDRRKQWEESTEADVVIGANEAGVLDLYMKTMMS